MKILVLLGMLISVCSWAGGGLVVGEADLYRSLIKGFR